MSAVVLAAGGMLTTWSGFQSQLWSGAQLRHYTEYSALRLQTTRLQTQADQRKAAELSMFTAWMDANAAGKRDLADYYRRSFPPTLGRAFEAWYALRPLDTDRSVRSPFDMPSYIRTDGAAKDLNAKADEAFRAGEAANQIADSFGQANVMLAMSMFLGGIAQVFRTPKLQVPLLVVAVLASLLGFGRVLSLPMLSPG